MRELYPHHEELQDVSLEEDDAKGAQPPLPRGSRPECLKSPAHECLFVALAAFAAASPGYPYPPSSQYHPTSQYPPTSKYPAQDAECRGRVLAPSFMRSTSGGKHHGKDGEKQLDGAGSA